MLARYYRRRGFVVACQDEATFGLIPNVVRGWAKRGSRPTARQNFRHEHTNVFGARTQHTFVYSFSKKKNQRVFVAFLKKLSRRWGKVCLFTDGAPWHKGKKLDHFLDKHHKTFRLIRFPKYAPELNPVEQCWKPARRAIGKRLITSLDTMEYHLRKVFSNQSLMPQMFKYLSN